MNLGICRLNIAILEKSMRSFSSSELNSFKALNYLKNNKRLKASVYNNLGVIYAKQKNYKEALNYHNKAYKLRKQLTKQIYTLQSLNNIANIYKKQHKYEKAIAYYNKALNDSVTLFKYPKMKARLLDNYAHTLLLQKQFNKLPQLFYKALHIRDSLQYVSGIIASNIRLGTYYTETNTPQKAIQYLEKAYTQAKKYKYNIDVLEALQLLMEVYPKDKAVKVAKEYIFLSDSLQQVERLAKDKFARVRFETAEKEQALAKNKVQLKKENQQKWLLGIGFLASLLTLGVFGYYYRKNQQQKKLIEDLQKELHHRVKNNLSIISRFVEVLKEEFNQPIFDKKLTELQNRISSINEVHQQLYNSKDVTNLNMKNYIGKLVANLQNSFPNYHIQTIQNVKENLKLTSTKSFPLGIIINEFLTNSYKYAFDNDNGIVNITMEEDSKHYKLLLSDNGKGLPVDFDIKTDANFGLRIIRLLCNQIDATFELKNNNGLELFVQMPKG